MIDGIALSEDVADPARLANAEVPAPVIRSTSRIDEVEAAWRVLAAEGVESPGQSHDVVRLWNQTQNIVAQDQLYIVAEIAGAAIALLPLRRVALRGLTALTWFPGTHVGCNAPLIDKRRLARLTSDERRALWRQMLAAAKGADLIFLPAVPHHEADGVDVFAELGTAIETETLYRAQFGGWEEANTTQRNKSRRKHDRQQGERLEALGAVEFAELGPGPEAAEVLALMFRQRALRFRQMGIADPFACKVRHFYDASVAPGSGVPVKLHVLRLNGEIVAVRYNIVVGDRLFCLISSMSDDPAIQNGSPGKQCLLRVMQLVFDAGATMFDMGAGFTDEKRHWCNVQVSLRQHYLPLTWKGAAAARLHRGWQHLRHRIKSDTRLLRMAKALRGGLVKLRGDSSPTTASQ